MTATMQRPAPAGYRAGHEVTLGAPASAASDPMATTRANLASMRAVLDDLEARRHGRGFTDNDRLRLLRTRAVHGLLTDTVQLVKTDRDAVKYLRWRATTTEAEAAAMADRRPSLWFPGRRRAIDEQVREKRAMAQEAASFATSIEVESRLPGTAPLSPTAQPRAAGQPTSRQHTPGAGRLGQSRVDKGVRAGGQFKAVSHAEAAVTLAAPPPAAPPSTPRGPSRFNRDGSDGQLRRLNDFLAPLEEMAARAQCSPDQEVHLLRGRRVRRILETAIHGTSSDAQVSEKLQVIRGQAEGQLRAAHAAAATGADQGVLANRMQELQEVIKDCGTYQGFLNAA